MRLFLLAFVTTTITPISGLLATETKAESSLVFATICWDGKYASKDKPGGVDTTAHQGAIYSILSDGSQETKIIDLGGDTTFPHFDFQGQWLYFQSNASGQYQVYRGRVDGTEITNLSALHRLGDTWREACGIALSGDGQKITYMMHDGNIGKTVIANADGSEAKFVAPELGYVYMAALNKTGNRIVFSGPSREYRLLLCSLHDNQVKMLTPDHPGATVPQFTPDDKVIVFCCNNDIYRVDSDGSHLQRLTNGNQYVRFKLSDTDHHPSSDPPSISVDGKQIAYIAKKDGVQQVFAMNLDGGEQRQITQRPTDCGRVHWSPSGLQLAFVSFVEGYPQLFVVDSSGGTPRQLTKVERGGVYYLNWHPKSKLLQTSISHTMN